LPELVAFLWCGAAPGVRAGQRVLQVLGPHRAAGADPLGELSEFAVALAGEPGVRVGLGAQCPLGPPSGYGWAVTAAPGIVRRLAGS
jgi:hypothetical protein